MLSDEEIIEAEKQGKKSPVVQRLLDFYLLSQSNPIEKLRNEMKEMSVVIAEDFKIIRTCGEKITFTKVGEGNETEMTSNLKILASNKNDKLFERIMAIYDKSDKIYNATTAYEKGEAKERTTKSQKGHEDKVVL